MLMPSSLIREDNQPNYAIVDAMLLHSASMLDLVIVVEIELS